MAGKLVVLELPFHYTVYPFVLVFFFLNKIIIGKNLVNKGI